MAYGIQSPTQQSFKPASRPLNKNQYDTFYFTDFNNPSQITYVDGGLFTTVTANSGAVTYNPTAALTAFGVTACSGTLQLSTSTTSNSTAAAAVTLGYNSTAYSLLLGLQTPSSSSLISKYEFETLIRTDATIFSSGASLGGDIRCGFMDTVDSTLLSNGVWIEYITNGTTNDTTFWVAWQTPGNSKQRSDTSVTVSANTTYRIYLGFEVNTAGTCTTTYKIKNMTTGTNTEGTASPATANRNPTNTSGTAAVVQINRETNTTTTAINLFLDYIGVRIRKPVTREILLGNF